MESTEQEILALIAESIKKDPADLSKDMTLDSLGIDSLRAITILYAIEDEFEIEIPNNVVEGLDTIADVIEAVLNVT